MDKKLELKFRAPDNVDDALQLINAIAIYIDLFLGRTDDWGLINLLSKAVDRTLWNTIAKCVITKSGVDLTNVSFSDLGTQGVLMALCVFCEGLESLELPEIMSSFCGGITTSALASMVKDIEKIRQEAEKIQNPGDILTHVISQALARSL